MRSRKAVVRIALTAVVLALLAGPTVWAKPDETEVIEALQNRIERLTEEVGKSVVSIEVKMKASAAGTGLDGGIPLDRLPPDIRRFFEDPYGQGDGDDEQPRRDLRRQQTPRNNEQLVPRGLGSGIIISSDGLILTNQHVVRNADKITVTLSDHGRLPAEVVGVDTRRDLAVLKVDAKNLSAVTLSPGAKVRRGMFVLAIGSPFGFGAEGQASVSYGIVSGTRRNLFLGDQGEDRYYGKLIQTDAAINPGNSGGALCDLEGRLVGINVAIASRSGGSQGVGFAIPIDELTVEIIDKLKKGEAVEYGYLGAGVRNPTLAESETAGAPERTGAFVAEVMSGGPADKAGVMPADLIVAIDGKPLADSDDLITEVGRTPPGKKVKLTLYRSGKKQEVAVEIALRDMGAVASNRPARRPSEDEDEGDQYKWRGMTLKDLTPALRREAGADRGVKGVFVDRVDEKSPAYDAEIRAGSIITQVGSKKVESLDDLKKAVKSIEGRVFVNILGTGPVIVGE